MKQYLSSEQTAKLIELGFEMPRYYCADKYFLTQVGFEVINYSIGELIEMLPKTITREIWWGEYRGKEGVWVLRIGAEGADYSWVISYERDNSAYLYREGRSDLIDALYDVIVLLKEEGVI